ncbi:MAG: hypothetical protein KGH60_00275 [Candidatus Micrarchaeota archaeon]|nr:hypothetical protein [Candidatus Micrarchaeota archaeon]
MAARKTRMMFALAVAALLVALAVPYSHAQPSSATQSSQSAPQLPVTPLNWLPVAITGVLLIAAIAAVVYMLSGFIGSSNAKTWSRMQVYEALVSIILIFAFGFFSYLFFLSPQRAFGSVGLVPPTCTGANDIFALATCDLSTFNAASFTMAGLLFYTSYLAGLIPELNIAINPIPTQPNIGAAFKAPLSPIPVSVENLYKIGFEAFLFMMVLNQIQLILISGSLLFLSFFLTLGLIVRTFGVTRSFGGAMIAFGLGLGLVYPLLVSITYGFVVTNSGMACLAPTVGMASAGSVASTIAGCLAGGASAAATPILQSIVAFAMGNFSGAAGAITGGAGSFILTIGYIVAGFTFIPFLNFTVLNAFIVDFSRAVGEQVDFMSLLSQFI